MNRAARRARKAARARAKCALKIPPKPNTGPPMIVAAHLMQRDNPHWESDWGQIQMLDIAITHLESLRLVGGGLSTVAFEMLSTLRPMRDGLVSKYSSEPTFPRDWYISACRQPGDREYQDRGNVFTLGSYQALNRS